MASMPGSTSTSDPARRRASGVPGWLLGLVLLAGPAGASAPDLAATVLMYHHVGNAETPSTSVTRTQFAAHLDYLARNDFNVVHLGQVVEALRTREPLPDRTVAITFDDGYESVGRVAHPMLAERGWPYTVFVNTRPVEAGYSGYLTWAEMAAMADEGARFANHSHRHVPLQLRRDNEARPQWRERVVDDIQTAQRRLVDRLGEAVHQDPPLLAYPFGEYSIELMDVVAELGYVALGQHSGAIGRHSNSLALPRFPMNERYADMDGFAVKVDALPLPVVSQTPLDPVREGDELPTLTVTLAPEAAIPEARLACFYQGQRLEPRWLAPGRRFAVQATGRLPVGRSRYNCTAPAGAGRFYWYSQLWIHGEAGT